MLRLDLPGILKFDICYDDKKLDLIEGQFEGQQLHEIHKIEL